MKYIGMVVILLSAWLFCREYTNFRRLRLEECEGFLELISYMREKVSCYMFTVREIGESFKCEALSRIGFMEALKKCKNADAAYTSIKDRLSLPKAADEILTGLFQKLGCGYLDNEITIIDSAYESFLKITEKERLDTPKDLRVFRMVGTSAALGVIIILL